MICPPRFERSVERETLLVFAKNPRPGTVKTRLIPALGEVAAADVYRRLAEHTFAVGRRVTRRSLRRLAVVAPSSSLPTMRAWIGGGFEIAAQSRGDLGERLAHAFTEAFGAGATRVVAIGTDCPELEAAHLERAFDLLDQRDVVIGPARDGGYYLIGSRAEERSLFREIPWSSGETLRVTKERIVAANLSSTELEPLLDLDDENDLHALEGKWPARLIPDGVPFPRNPTDEESSP